MNGSSISESSHKPPWAGAFWAVAAAFGAYFCMYGFRRPYTAATNEDFGGVMLGAVDYKTLLIMAQTLGYALSKFIGIKVVAETPPRRRAVGILLLIGIAELALILLGAFPSPYNFLALFLNGLSLGMVFGLVMGFLEGRRVSEAMLAGLCASFILADDVMKTVGATLLTAGVSPYWMPAAAGALFALPLMLFVWMLSRIPPPTEQDVQARSARKPMNREDRRRFLAQYGVGIGLIVAMYVFVTILRSVRTDFLKELFIAFDVPRNDASFAIAGVWTFLGVIAINGMACLIPDNRRAFFSALLVSGAGLLLILLAWGLHSQNAIGGFALLVLIGLGLYLPYVAVHTTVFERLIAITRQPANVAFLMYIADAWGYAAYVALMFFKSWSPVVVDFTQAFFVLCVIVSGVCLACIAGCVWCFRGQLQESAAPVAAANEA